MNKYVSGKHLARDSDLAGVADSPCRAGADNIALTGTRGAGAMGKLVSSKHLEGVSDLTLSAPIRPGFINAFESVTYETRLRMLLKALFKIRSTAREHSLIKPFVDTAERIQSLLDFRLAILDTEPRRLLLSATFDRPFEPYMRLIWDPLGPLLDVIFCNCDGYVTATEHGFPEYLDWVRRSQIDSNFFYAASGLSIDDILYLSKLERMEREAAEGRPLAASVVVDDPQLLARRIREGVDPAMQELETKILSNQLGMQALVALYRLTDVYPPDQPDGDGKYLRWATQQLLAGWGREQLDEDNWSSLVQEQLAWFEGDQLPPQAREPERLEFNPANVQGGIIANFPRVRSGALLLMRITDAAKARRHIGRLDVERECDPPGKQEPASAPAVCHYLNVAFTPHGIAKIGVPAEELERFPQEFREGMEERAGLIGDVRNSHPRRWNLPKRYRRPAAALAADVPVELAEVDIVIQLRTTEESAHPEIVDGHPLYRTVERFADDPESGLELLAVEPMRRASSGNDKRDHFGFVDGISQPRPVDGNPRRDEDEVARGEIFVGYSNDRGDSPPKSSDFLDDGTFLVLRKLRQHVGLLHDFVKKESSTVRRAKDGSEYTIPEEELYGKLMGRKRDGTLMLDGIDNNKFDYRTDARGEQCPFQSHIRRSNPRARRSTNNNRPTPRILRRGLSYGPPVDKSNPDDADRGVFFMAYNASIAEQYEVIQRWLNGGNPTGVGSWQNDPLMGIGQAGDKRTFQFQYRPAPHAACETVRLDIPTPFVSLEWGAYLFVPSLAAIQKIAGLPPAETEKPSGMDADQVERGRAIVDRLLALAKQGPEGRIAAAAGWKTYLEDFTAKDPGESADGPAVWAAIRACHGGVLRVPYGIVERPRTTPEPGDASRRPCDPAPVGPIEPPPDVVLVAGKQLVMDVFRNREGHYSMCGQMQRMKQSFGPIFLGLDGGPEYKADSAINAFILEVSDFQAFAIAYAVATRWLEEALKLFCELYGPPDQQPEKGRYGELDLRRDFVTPVLAGICNYWFGIPDSLRIPAHPSFNLPTELPTVDRCPVNHVDPGGWGWEKPGKGGRKPRCPGDFLATSRYCFYPDPVPAVQKYGQEQGRALREAIRDHFVAHIQPKAKLAAFMATLDVYDKDRDKFARTLIGVMTGFLPPADATLRWALYEWLEGKSFWRVQQDVVGAEIDPGEEKLFAAAVQRKVDRADAYAATAASIAVNPYLRAKRGLLESLKRSMQKRPAPDMLWRTAISRHSIGDVQVRKGDRVFIGIVSAMAEDAEAGETDVYPVFGGKREKQGEDHPLHACPAYEFAMGTMMGILAALMDKVRVEALPAPLLVKISDRKACRAKTPAEWGA